MCTSSLPWFKTHVITCTLCASNNHHTSIIIVHNMIKQDIEFITFSTAAMLPKHCPLHWFANSIANLDTSPLDPNRSFQLQLYPWSTCSFLKTDQFNIKHNCYKFNISQQFVSTHIHSIISYDPDIYIILNIIYYRMPYAAAWFIYWNTAFIAPILYGQDACSHPNFTKTSVFRKMSGLKRPTVQFFSNLDHRGLTTWNTKTAYIWNRSYHNYCYYLTYNHRDILMNTLNNAYNYAEPFFVIFSLLSLRWQYNTNRSSQYQILIKYTVATISCYQKNNNNNYYYYGNTTIFQTRNPQCVPSNPSLLQLSQTSFLMSVVIPPRYQPTSEYYSRIFFNLTFGSVENTSVTLATEDLTLLVDARGLVDSEDNSSVHTVPCDDDQSSHLPAEQPWQKVTRIRVGSVATKAASPNRRHVHHGDAAARATTSPPCELNSNSKRTVESTQVSLVETKSKKKKTRPTWPKVAEHDHPRAPAVSGRHTYQTNGHNSSARRAARGFKTSIPERAFTCLK